MSLKSSFWLRSIESCLVVSFLVSESLLMGLTSKLGLEGPFSGDLSLVSNGIGGVIIWNQINILASKESF